MVDGNVSLLGDLSKAQSDVCGTEVGDLLLSETLEEPGGEASLLVLLQLLKGLSDDLLELSDLTRLPGFDQSGVPVDFQDVISSLDTSRHLHLHKA